MQPLVRYQYGTAYACYQGNAEATSVAERVDIYGR